MKSHHPESAGSIVQLDLRSYPNALTITLEVASVHQDRDPLRPVSPDRHDEDVLFNNWEPHPGGSKLHPGWWVGVDFSTRFSQELSSLYLHSFT